MADKAATANARFERLKRPVLLPVTASFVVLTTLFLVAVFWIDRGHHEEQLNGAIASIESSFLRKMDEQASLFSSHLLFLHGTPCFRDSWRADDRIGLLACTQGALSGLRELFQIRDLVLLDSDFRYVLRVAEPDRFGDIDQGFVFRRAAANGGTAYGLELAPDGELSMLVALPWQQGAVRQGFTGVRISLSDILDHVASLHAASLVVFTEKRLIDQQAWQQHPTSLRQRYPWGLFPSHLVVYSDGSALPKRIGIEHRGPPQPGRQQITRFSDAGRHYAADVFPLLDQGGRFIGHVGVTLDITQQMQQRWSLIGAFTLLFLVSGSLFFLLFRRYLERVEMRVQRSSQSLEQELVERGQMEISLRKLSSAVKQSGSAVMITDKHGRIEYINPKFTQVTGYRLSEIRGNTPSFLRSDRTSQETHRQLWSSILSGRTWVGDLHNRRKNGELYWSHLSIAPIIEESGKITNFVATSEDITQMKDAQDEMERLAFFDTLTNLPNRRLFRDRLERTVMSLQRSGGKAALLFLDLDQFKKINDTLGHDAGDTLLNEVADRLRSVVRENDTIARLGGDEFTILLQDINGLPAARRVAQKILNTMHLPFILAGREVAVTTSIGITLAPEDGLDTGCLMKNADLAMYEAKAKGRNNFQFFTRAMNDEVAQRVLLEHELMDALKNQEFQLFYQPILAMDGGEVTGMEALLRWRHPDRGLLAPNVFLAAAEESNIINEIGSWVLLQACREVTRLNRIRRSRLSVSINLSARQFGDPGLVDIINYALSETGLARHLLHLEITESMLMEEHINPIDTMMRLKQSGIYLSVDDFGTGYSSLSYLKRFPVDRLKVDRSFVKDIPGDLSDMEITAAIIVLAHKLNLEVVAEGVETIAQYQFLKQNQCDLLQGYLFSKPLPMESLEQKLDQIGINFLPAGSVLHLPKPVGVSGGER